MVKNILISLFVLLCTLSVTGQSLRGYVTVTKKEAYVGQPVEIRVSVLTTTWFTSGIDVGNITVDNALTVYFRSVSTSREINGKQFSGVDFYYNLFPTSEGQITIPSIEVNVETPKEGDYKGIARVIKTAPKTLKVNPIPLGYDPTTWMVASGLNVKQSWSLPLENIKVGDVLERTVRRNVSGTLAEFIPATTWDSINGVSNYPKTAKVNTTKSRTGVSANRTETINYLFEQEGPVTIPGIEYVYWNSSSKKFYKKQLDSVVINVAPNADLEMLASIKESLEAQNIKEQAEDGPLLILGLTPKTFAKYLLFGILVLYFLIKLIKRLIPLIKRRYYLYINSETYAFKMVKNAIRSNDYSLFVKASHLWLRKLSDDLTLKDLAKGHSECQLEAVLIQFDEVLFEQHKSASKEDYNKLLIEIKKARKIYFADLITHQNTPKNKDWLNPTR